MADAQVHGLLSAWSLEKYANVFKENEIDIEAMEFLTERMIEQIIVPIGDRAKFLNRLSLWKSSKDSENPMTKISEDRNYIQLGGTNQELSANNSTELNYSLGIQENHSYDDEENNFCHSTPTSKRHNNSVAAEKEDFSNTSDLFQERAVNVSEEKIQADNAPLLENSILKLLDSSPDGKYLLASYHTSGKLDSAGRNKLSNIVIKNELRVDPGAFIPASKLKQLADEICEVFKNEVAATYYNAYVASRNGLPRKLASGKLQDCYHNRRREYKRVGIVKQRCSTEKNISFVTTDNVAAILEADISEESQIYEENIKWLNFSSDPWDTVEEYWSITKAIRLKEILCASTPCTVSTYLNKYPALKKPTGYLLLLRDFEFMYPQKSRNLHLQFPLYKTAIIEAARKQLLNTKDTITKTVIAEYLEASKSNEEVSNIATFLLIPFLISGAIGKKGKGAWRPSKIESRDGFICFVRSEPEIQETLRKHKDKLRLKGFTFQPLVLIVGASLEEIKSYYVVVDSTFYQLHSILDAVDCTFKTFHTLGAHYPNECLKLWHFIQKGFYDINTRWDHSFTSVTTFINDLGIIH